MRPLLFMFIYFVAFSALSTGLILIIKPDGNSMGLTVNMLKSTPFHNFLIPGLLLVFIIGGVNLLALLLNIFNHPKTYKVTMAAGIIVTGWIIAQLLLISSFSWLAGLYLVIGILICLFSWQIIRKPVF